MKSRTYDDKYTMLKWWELSEQAEQKSIPAYKELIRPGDLVFDIGANRGRKVWIFRQLGAKVLAVDPLYTFGWEFVPEFYWRFGDDKMVTSYGMAVSDKRGKMTLSIQRNLPYLSSVDNSWMKTSAHKRYYNDKACLYREVQTTTLDALINVYGIPRFLKVDVEGHEDTALAGLSTPVPALNMEFHQDWLPRAAIARVDELAEYEWNYCLNNEGRFVMPDWMDSTLVLRHMEQNLTKEGPLSWGDIYARRVDAD